MDGTEAPPELTVDCKGFKAKVGKGVVIDLRTAPSKIAGAKKTVVSTLDQTGVRAVGAKGNVFLVADSELMARLARQRAVVAGAPAEQVFVVRCPTPGR